MSNTPVNNLFTMDDNLLLSVIKSQAGTLAKALLEGVMNSIDAGASCVKLTLTETMFVIEDDGKGFCSAQEVERWFGRFGTPHQEGDATFGKFRMGRGQLMAFAATRWLSNKFCMEVDIEKLGLSYNVSSLTPAIKGCRVEGQLYAPLKSYDLKDLITELRKFVAYAPKPVYANGELLGASPARLKSWTFETEDAYFKVASGADELLVYNQGIYVQALGSWKTGMGGVVVSKKPLEVNFARNAVLEHKCQVWRNIRSMTERLVADKLTTANKLTDSERSYLSRRVLSGSSEFVRSLKKAKLLTDPSGRHTALETLCEYSRFVYVPEANPLACAVHGTDRTFVVTDKLLRRFGLYQMDDFLREMDNIGVMASRWELIEQSELSTRGLGSAENLEKSLLYPRIRAGLATLEWLNLQIATRLRANGYSAEPRRLLAGLHKQSSFVAWTDGKTYVTVNKPYVKKLESGLDGALYWAQVLVHEYMHDTDDSESHAHGDVFYEKFHDAIHSNKVMALASLAQQTVVVYLNALQAHGLGRPRHLTGQLRPSFSLDDKAELELASVMTAASAPTTVWLTPELSM